MSQAAARPWPAAMRVLERGWVSSNNIVFLGERETAVVDTGYARHNAQTVALLRHTLGGRPLDRIVNTHTHSDHIGGNAALQRAWPGVHTIIPAGEAEVVRQWDEEALHLGPLGQECERFNFEATFQAGDTLVLGNLSWRAIGSPGHDMESLVLYCEAERILISADALWENGFGVLFPDLTGEAAPGTAIATQRATLDAIAALDVERVIPGHGAPFTDVRAALARARARLDYLAADPLRNARNAAKVALAFVLMIEGRLALADLPRRVASMSLVSRINREYLHIEESQLAAHLAGELEKSRAARREDGWLVAA